MLLGILLKKLSGTIVMRLTDRSKIVKVDIADKSVGGMSVSKFPFKFNWATMERDSKASAAI
jgi:hypothetical protein